nr:MAG TPA: hypothetical protein [Caudoviricetes sp.]
MADSQCNGLEPGVYLERRELSDTHNDVGGRSTLHQEEREQKRKRSSRQRFRLLPK